MSVNGGPPPEEEDSSRGLDARTLEMACLRIARQLALGPARIVGFLPVGGRAGRPGRARRAGRAGQADQAGDDETDLAPLLDELGGALTQFARGDVALVSSFPRWAGGGDRGAAPLRIREIRPHLLEVTPRPCDALVALSVLEQTLTTLASGIVRVLVDLTGYSPAGRVPTVVDVCDGVVPVVTARDDRVAEVTAFLRDVPASKNLGVILVG
jgi:hypothetical protein